jgi:two-component system sensor histidine kinase KdpD
MHAGLQNAELPDGRSRPAGTTNRIPGAPVTPAENSSQRLNMARVFEFAKWCGSGSLAVFLLTLLGFRLGFSLAAVSLCYLLLVVLLSLSGDFAATLVVSILAVACLDYFFTDPLFSFEVASPLNVLALFCFFVTALVVTGLVSKVRDKTASSRLQHQNTRQLYGLAQQLLALEPDGIARSNFLEPFRGAFGVTAACMFDGATAELHIAGEPSDELQEKTRQAYYRGWDRDDRNSKISVRCMRVGDKTKGAIGFDGLQDPETIAGPLTALAAALLERMLAFRNASEASAAAQTEAYRSVILDALAHEFKTPLSTILAAAGAIREAGSLGPEHMEMADTVESEAARLGRLTTRLIRTARLEREEVKPWMELVDISTVVADTLEQYSRLTAERPITIAKECSSSEVVADPELLRLALSQLLDNACKYSPPGSPVLLKISREDNRISVRVISDGTPIANLEKARIFERFYRGTEARRMAAGTGLGLYVARKIALAHGGSLELDNEPPGGGGTTFRLSIPVLEGDRNNVRAIS